MAEHRVDVSDLPAGEARALDVAGKRIAVAVTDRGPVAFDDTCTHMSCSLAKGEIEDGTVICPCHEGTFDLATGAVVSGPPPRPIAVYPARLDGNALVVEVP